MRSIDFSWNLGWTQPKPSWRFSLSGLQYEKTDSIESMVFELWNPSPVGRHSSLWLNLYRDAFCIDCLLELQILLYVREDISSNITESVLDVYGFLLLVFAILTAVTMCVTVVVTYFKLNSEDYRWQWMAFGSGASTSVYVFMYSCYYFFFKTQMSGLFQTVFYIGYSLLLASGIGCLCASLSFTGANLFISRIYKDIKSD
jgi:hypothetical protein